MVFYLMKEKMSNKKHNGWTNRETWLVDLWFGEEAKKNLCDKFKHKFLDHLAELPSWAQDFIDYEKIDWLQLEKAWRGI